MFFEVMVGWLLAYVESVEDEIRSGALLELDLDAHAAFYSICQAVLCVVCYRPDTFADHSEVCDININVGMLVEFVSFALISLNA